MADGDWPNQNSLLSGLFGSFQSSIQSHASTADLWSDLRANAATWFYQSQGGGETPTDEELQETGRRILSEQGVGIQQVNTYRALSNQWATAKANLASNDPGDQIETSDIFRPPWAQSAGAGVPDRYRVRVGWQISPAGEDQYTKWASYELTSPITNMADVLDQAGSKMAGDKYIQLLNGGDFPDVADYEIELI